MSKKRGLGRGLSALLEDVETDITTGNTRESSARVLGSVAYLPVSAIEANPFQPRTVFDEGGLQELATSIKAYGIIQPVTVRKVGNDKFQLISGERRFRASQLAGLDEIPAYIRVANDQAMLEMALVENIQRRDLDAIEVAISYQRLIEECKLTQEALSGKVGKKRATISNYLRLLRLPAEIQAGIRLNKISMGHARALITIENTDKQLGAFNRVLDEGLSVRQTELLVQEAKPASSAPASSTTRNKEVPLSLSDQKIKSELIDHFSAKVGLRKQSNGSGKIEIYFKSEDEFQRIIDLLEP